MDLKSEFLIRDEADLRAIFPPTHPLAAQKVLPALDHHARAYIARSPFLVMGTIGSDGGADVSPRGDAPGFVLPLSDTLLAIPDRPGNNRLDSQINLLSNAAVGLIFMIPGFEETLRINGRALLSRDPQILEHMAVQERLPRVAIVVQIDEVFLHCAKAFRRARLWEPEAQQDRKAMPSLRAMVEEQISGQPPSPEDVKKMDAQIEEAYRNSMY